MFRLVVLLLCFHVYSAARIRRQPRIFLHFRLRQKKPRSFSKMPTYLFYKSEFGFIQVHRLSILIAHIVKVTELKSVPVLKSK